MFFITTIKDLKTTIEIQKRQIEQLKQEIEMLNDVIQKKYYMDQYDIADDVCIKANTILKPVRSMQHLLTGDIYTSPRNIERSQLLYFLSSLEEKIINETLNKKE